MVQTADHPSEDETDVQSDWQDLVFDDRKTQLSN